MKSLVKRNGNLFPAIPALFDDFFNREWLDSSMATWRDMDATLPAVNVKETDDAFAIDVAAPGMKRDDFKVELHHNILTISSERQAQSEDNVDGQYSRREFSYQAFQRSFSLPENKVEGDKISARYVDGILQISIPKREEAKVKPPKQIAVS